MATVNPTKTVFISYRRSVSSFIARAVFQDLRYNGFDCFIDVESIDAGAFDEIILNQIAARAHFVVVLTPGAVERCIEPGDWLRREIEEAMRLERNIVPLLVNGFDFDVSNAYLTGKLTALRRYNAVTVAHDYFEESMTRLRTRFLQRQFTGVTAQTPTVEKRVVAQKIETASQQPEPSAEQLSAEEYYDRGHQKWVKGDYEGAIVDCGEAIRLNPNFVEAYNRRGSAYVNQSKFHLAMRDFQEVLQLAPDYVYAHFNLGLAYAAQANYEAAQRHYSDALRLDPLLTQAYYSRALARVARDDYRGAAADYRKFLDLGGGEAFGNGQEVLKAIADLENRWQP